MENREQQILSEIKTMMSQIRMQLEQLDAKMAELQQCVDPEEFDTIPIDIEDDFPFEDLPEDVPAVEAEAEPVTEQEPELPAEAEIEADETPAESEIEPEAETEEEVEEEEEEVEVEPEVEAEVEAEAEVVAEPESVVEDEEEDDDDLPGVFDTPMTINEAVKAMPKAKPTVAELMEAKQAWRIDMPGSPVKDVRSAISLNDRIIFINYLFNEDPMTFQDTITRINTMNSLDEVVDYLTQTHPDWDFDSELVYRFMMAVRRRVK